MNSDRQTSETNNRKKKIYTLISLALIIWAENNPFERTLWLERRKIKTRVQLKAKKRWIFKTINSYKRVLCSKNAGNNLFRNNTRVKTMELEARSFIVLNLEQLLFAAANTWKFKMLPLLCFCPKIEQPVSAHCAF